jgi:hypothetical protein
MTTEGNKNQSQALYILGGKALWTKELEVVLLDGAVDMLKRHGGRYAISPMSELEEVGQC